MVVNSIDQTQINQLTALGQDIKTIWRNLVEQVVYVGSKLEDFYQNLINSFNKPKADKIFKQAIASFEHFPSDFAKVCLKVFRWYSTLPENQRRFLRSFGWGISPSCLKELTKIPGELLQDFIQNLGKERKKIKLKDIRDFLANKTKIKLNIPLEDEHWEIVQRHYDLNVDSLEVLQNTIETFSIPTTNNLEEVLRGYGHKTKRLFIQPKAKANSNEVSQYPQKEKMYTASEVKILINEAVNEAVNQVVNVKAEETVTKEELAKVLEQSRQDNLEQSRKEFFPMLEKMQQTIKEINEENKFLKESLKDKEQEINNLKQTIKQKDNEDSLLSLTSKSQAKRTKPVGFG